MEWYYYLIAVLGGTLAGVLNTLAGNGSAITLSILTLIFQLPENTANGTNRVGIMLQSLVSTNTFYRKGKLNIRRSLPFIIPTVIGALLGVWAALLVTNDQFRFVFTVLMVVMLVVILVKPKRWLQPTNLDVSRPLWIIIPVFLALGFYGGFIQMGMGVFFLAAMVLGARYSIIEANGVKIFVVGLYTIAVLAIFASRGLVDWRIGGILAAGQGIGAWMAARFATDHPKADVWAHRLLVIVVLAAVLKLIGIGQWFSL
ncbi:MAG: sulfite exporter TauE/SafE family protein [Bacteroidota bacterium]